MSNALDVSFSFPNLLNTCMYLVLTFNYFFAASIENISFLFIGSARCFGQVIFCVLFIPPFKSFECIWKHENSHVQLFVVLIGWIVINVINDNRMPVLCLWLKRTKIYTLVGMHNADTTVAMLFFFSRFFFWTRLLN